MTPYEIARKINSDIRVDSLLTHNKTGNKKRYICPFCGSGTHGKDSTGDVEYYPKGNYAICYGNGHEHIDALALIAKEHGITTTENGTTSHGHARIAVKGKGFFEALKIGMQMLGISESELDESNNKAPTKSYDTTESRFKDLLEKVQNPKTKESFIKQYNDEPKETREILVETMEEIIKEREIDNFLDSNFEESTLESDSQTVNTIYNKMQQSERKAKDAFESLAKDSRYTADKIEKLYSESRSELVESDFYHYLKNKESYEKQAKIYSHLRTGFYKGYTSENLEKNERFGIDKVLIPRRGIHVILAQSSMGKTTFALNLADNYAEQKQPVVYITTEMSEHDLYSKSLNRFASVYLNKGDSKTTNPLTVAKVKNPSALTADEKESLQKATIRYIKDISEYMHIVKIKNRDITHICEIIDFFMQYYRTATESETAAPPIIFIDYLQLLKDDSAIGKDRRLEVDAIMEKLEGIRDRYNACIYILSAISRSSYGKRLDMDAAKESGEIESTAESIMTLEFTQILELNTPTTKQIDECYRGNTEDHNARFITLRFLKNRDNDSRGASNFKYYPMHDVFLLTDEKPKKLTDEKPKKLQSAGDKNRAKGSNNGSTATGESGIITI